jgi:iron complex outermembrane receptor protein
MTIHKFIRGSLLGSILFLSAPLVTYASGSIRGLVQSGGAGIVGATVQILELNRMTHTGASGDYLFTDVPAGRYRVFVRMLGYASMTREVHVGDSISNLFFNLTESALPGEEIVVSAVPYARSTSDQYQSVATVPMEELHESSGGSFAEEIADLPGVSVRYNGSAPARPMLRGLTDNDVLVTENGLRTGDISTFDPAHAVPIEPEAVERVDVIRGPASVMFGPNAVGGVVNVTTSLIPSASSTPVTGRFSVMGNTVSDLY